MSDSEMFPFEPEKVMGSEGHAAEKRADFNGYLRERRKFFL